MATDSEKKDWQSIAEEASKEKNPARLMALVRQLCSALDDSKKAPAPDQPRLLDLATTRFPGVLLVMFSNFESAQLRREALSAGLSAIV